MAKTDQRNLSRRERQIMDIIYQRGNATAMEVMNGMPDPPGYSTVRTLLSVLERKGFLHHKRQSYHYVYTPTIPAAEARSSALEHLMDTFFEGSATRIVSALMHLKQDELKAEELEEIKQLIEEAKADDR